MKKLDRYTLNKFLQKNHDAINLKMMADAIKVDPSFFIKYVRWVCDPMKAKKHSLADKHLPKIEKYLRERGFNYCTHTNISIVTDLRGKKYTFCSDCGNHVKNNFDLDF